MIGAFTIYPSSSVESSNQDGGSNPSSRTSSSEYSAPASKMPGACERELDVVDEIKVN